MRRFRKSFRYGEKGFTLIELLIVVAILGILAAVVIPNLGGFLTTGNLAAANTEAENMKTASLAYYAENSAYPDASDNLTPFLAGTPKATYTFDVDYGWLLTVSAGTWPGIEWEDGNSGTVGNHGKWIRTP